MSYSKLDSGIVNSSIWSEPLATRVLWITMLAMSDENGFVSTSLPGLVRAANIPKEDFISAIKALESPDEYSRTEEYEGRRVEKIEGGWVILNFKKYRERYEVIKKQTRERVQRFRDRNKNVTHGNVTETLSPVSVSSSSSEFKDQVIDTDPKNVLSNTNTSEPQKPVKQVNPMFETFEAYLQYLKKGADELKVNKAKQKVFEGIYPDALWVETINASVELYWGLQSAYEELKRKKSKVKINWPERIFKGLRYNRVYKPKNFGPVQIPRDNERLERERQQRIREMNEAKDAQLSSEDAMTMLQDMQDRLSKAGRAA